MCVYPLKIFFVELSTLSCSVQRVQGFQCCLWSLIGSILESPCPATVESSNNETAGESQKIHLWENLVTAKMKKKTGKSATNQKFIIENWLYYFASLTFLQLHSSALTPPEVVRCWSLCAPKNDGIISNASKLFCGLCFSARFSPLFSAPSMCEHAGQSPASSAVEL